MLWQLLFFFVLTATPTTAKDTVLVIGDSMFAGGSTVVQFLESRTNLSFDNCAIVGAGVLDGYVPSIPSQYILYRRPQEFLTVLMDGGGNDVISHRGDCEYMDNECETVLQQVKTAINTTLYQMKEDGVQNVVYMGFYYIFDFQPVIDRGAEIISTVCEAAPLNCVFADARNMTFAKSWDGVHPMEDGYEMLGQLILDTARNHSIFTNQL